MEGLSLLPNLRVNFRLAPTPDFVQTMNIHLFGVLSTGKIVKVGANNGIMENNGKNRFS